MDSTFLAEESHDGLCRGVIYVEHVRSLDNAQPKIVGQVNKTESGLQVDALVDTGLTLKCVRQRQGIVRGHSIDTMVRIHFFSCNSTFGVQRRIAHRLY